MSPLASRQDYRDRQHRQRLALRSKRRSIVIRAEEIGREAIEDFEPECPMGVQTWKNPNNGMSVFRCHFLAHPGKRDPAWAERERKQNPMLFDRDENIDFSSKTGMKVFSDWDWNPVACDCECVDCKWSLANRGNGFHSTLGAVLLPSKCPDWWPIITLTDPGFRNYWATLVCRLDSFGIVHVTHSVVERGLRYRVAKKRINALIPGGVAAAIAHVIDPAATQSRPESRWTLHQQMARKPFPMHCIMPRHMDTGWLELQELFDMMVQREDGRFGTYFHSNNARVIEAFRTAVWDKDEKLDRRDIDPIDALKYGALYRKQFPVRPMKPYHLLDSKERQARRLKEFAVNARKQAMKRQEDLWKPQHMGGPD